MLQRMVNIVTALREGLRTACTFIDKRSLLVYSLLLIFEACEIHG